MKNFGVWVTQEEYVEVEASTKEEAEIKAKQEVLNDKRRFDGTFCTFQTTDLDELDEEITNMAAWTSDPWL